MLRFMGSQRVGHGKSTGVGCHCLLLRDWGHIASLQQMYRMLWNSGRGGLRCLVRGQAERVWRGAKSPLCTPPPVPIDAGTRWALPRDCLPSRLPDTWVLPRGPRARSAFPARSGRGGTLTTPARTLSITRIAQPGISGASGLLFLPLLSRCPI